jgi:hypothetical protein
MLVFWVGKPCGLAQRYQGLAGTALKMETVCPSEPTSQHGVITQKKNIDISTAVRTSNLIKIPYFACSIPHWSQGIEEKYVQSFGRKPRWEEISC